MSADAKEIIRNYEKLVSARSPWDVTNQELKELVRPGAMDFNRQSAQGSKRTDKIFDGTALWSSEQLASGLHSDLTNPIDRWFNLRVDDDELMEDEDVLKWLEIVADHMYNHYSSAEVGFNPALHECYLDLAVFGTAVIYQDRDSSTFKPYVRAIPLAQCYILENSSGRIDTCYRKLTYTTRQVLQRFREKTPAKILVEKDQQKEWTIIHAVHPRTDRDAYKIDNLNMPFASCWVCLELKELILEGGYKENPYHVPRWTKSAGEVYGRSPAWACLPDIKMLNEMSKTVLRAAQKIVDPPLMVPDDGFILPVKTMPSSLNFYQAGSTDRIEPLETKGRVDIGLEMMDQRREHITRAFYVDWLRREQKKERQTQLEISDVRDEMRRMMAPMLGRLEGELLSPLLARTYNLEVETNNLPLAPENLRRSLLKLKIEFVSPAARAQMGSKITSLQQAMNDLAPLAQLRPDIFDVIDTDEFSRLVVSLRDVSPTVRRKRADVTAIREQRAQQQQLSQGAQVGGTIASGMKDLASAQALTTKANG